MCYLGPVTSTWVVSAPVVERCAPSARSFAPDPVRWLGWVLLLTVSVGCRSSLQLKKRDALGPVASGLEPSPLTSVPALPSAPAASSSTVVPPHPTPLASDGAAPADAAAARDAGCSDLGGHDSAHDGSEDFPFDVAEPLPSALGLDAGATYVPASAIATGSIRIDGEILDWGEQGWFQLNDFVAQPGPAPSSEHDLRAVFALRWEASRLYFAVAVRDDEQQNAQSGFSIFDGDSVQVAFATHDLEPYDWEYGLALTSSGPLAHGWVPSDVDLTPNLPFAIARSGDVTYYEWALVAERLGQQSFSADTALGFGLIVNEADGAEGRSGFLQLVPGVGQSPKSARDFVSVALH